MIDEIYGRSVEVAELEEAYQSNEAEFVAVYGRRRVGKTYLISHLFQNKECCYFQTTGIRNAKIQIQLMRFAKEIGRTFYNGAPIQAPQNWMEAFDLLSQAMLREPKDKKIILFIDELPWLVTHKSDLLHALEYFWNRHWVNDHRVKLIVCGSSASWIIKKIVKNRGGLHNRVTRRIKLRPFDLYEASLFLKGQGIKHNNQQLFKIYSAFGGIPFYLKQIKKNQSITQNISRLFFDADGALFGEFYEVFSSLFKHSGQHEELVKIIAAHSEGLSRNDVEKRNKLTGKGGQLSRRLEELEQAGFISSYMPFGRKDRGLLYRIADEYCFFFLKWVEPIKTQLKQDPNFNYWNSCINTPKYYNWLGYSFENICYKHTTAIKSSLGIDSASLASPWRYMPIKKRYENGTQIDLVFDRPDDTITLCEIKYTDKPFVIDEAYAKNLLNKINVFAAKTNTKKQLFLTLISANGYKENLYSDELVAQVVTLDDIIAVIKYK